VGGRQRGAWPSHYFVCVCARVSVCEWRGLEGGAVDVHFKGNRFNQISKSGTACDVGETE